MADEKVIRVVIEGGTGTGGSSKPGSSKQTLNDLEKEARLTKSSVEQRRLLNKAVKESAKLYGDNSARTTKLKQSLEKANKAARDFGRIGKENQNSWGKALDSYQFKFNALGNIIANVTSTATRLFVKAMKDVVNISKEFESEMSAVKAVSRATSEQFERLRQDAIRLGGATIFTAKEVASLQLQLSKLGFTPQEVISATEGILSLAAAAGEELAPSAAIAGGVIRAFGEDANNVNRIVDSMAASFTSSALDLEKFRESMKFLAPVASKVGFTMEETTAVLGALADQMVHGSLAGTSLRNIFLRLSNENSKLSQAMGISAKSLPQLIVGLENLQRASLDATMALELTDRRAVTALLAMAQQSDGIWELYRSIVETTGAADEMAEIRMDNLAGSVEKLTGAWESLVLALNKSNGLIRILVDDARDVIEKLTGSLKKRTDLINDEAARYLSIIKKSAQNEIAARTKAINDELELEKKRYDTGKVSLEEYNDFMIGKDRELTLLRKEELLSQLKDQRVITEMQIEDSLILLGRANGKELRQRTILHNQLLADKKIVNETILAIEKDGSTERLKQLLNDAGQALADEDKIAKLRISIMADGVAKELAQNEYKWNAIRDLSNELGVVINDLEARRLRDRLEIIEKFNKKELEAIRKQEKEKNAVIEGWNKKREKNEDIEFMIEKLRIEAMADGVAKFTAFENLRYEEQVKQLGRQGLTYDQHHRAMQSAFSGHFQKLAEIQNQYGDKAVKNMKAVVSSIWNATQEEIEGSAVNPDENAPSLWDKITGGLEMTSEQESAVKKGVQFLSDQLNYLADKQREYADRAVENSERKVDQLQRDLEIELRLAEAGFASNVSLRQKELESAKAAQTQALAQQEAAIKRQEQLEAISQAVNLTSAIAGILKSTFTSMDPLNALLVSAGAATALMGVFSLWKNNIKAETQSFGEGGEIHGPKHTQGGVEIEAEGGEYMVKAEQYAKYRDLVVAINEDKVNQAWKGLNQDLNVNSDNSDMIGAMNKYWGTKITHHDGYRVERSANRTRKIYA